MARRLDQARQCNHRASLEIKPYLTCTDMMKKCRMLALILANKVSLNVCPE